EKLDNVSAGDSLDAPVAYGRQDVGVNHTLGAGHRFGAQLSDVPLDKLRGDMADGVGVTGARLLPLNCRIAASGDSL
ncbi:MAG TPA: hypothetical protein VFE89_06360, partial [Beijerinckiaceae bacterium]|nr:hypothetical protein [Beijerinckiaceae bacterium]